jgi:hypothetical protein
VDSNRQVNNTEADVCSVEKFMWKLNNQGPYCCPGVIDQQQGQSNKAYCCVGAPIPNNGVWTTTQTSCATTVSLFPQSDYTSKVKEAATKYSVVYTTDVGKGSATVISTITVGASAASSTGAAAARFTIGAAANGMLMVAGGLLLNT